MSDVSLWSAAELIAPVFGELARDDESNVRLISRQQELARG